VPSITGKRSATSAALDSLAGPEDYDFGLDTENMDPSLFSAKKAKGSYGTPVKAASAKSSLFSLTPANTTTAMAGIISPRKMLSPTRPLSRSLGGRRNALSASSTPLKKNVSFSAGGAENRRHSAPYRRIDPPASTTQASANTGFSSSSFSVETPRLQHHHRRQASVLPPAKNPKWEFAIYEDTEDEHLTNMVQHSTGTLYISDDSDSESSLRKERDSKGKENVPPLDFVPSLTNSSSPSQHSVSGSINAAPEVSQAHDCKKNLPQWNMMDRSPLGDLPAAEYFGEGLDSSSFVLVSNANKVVEEEQYPYEEDAETDVEDSVDGPAPAPASSSALPPMVEADTPVSPSPLPASLPAALHQQQVTEQAAPLAHSELPLASTEQQAVSAEEVKPELEPVAPTEEEESKFEFESTNGEFQIWESGSCDGDAPTPTPL
jgi:hypothetical protein